MQVLRFVRGKGEYRQVSISKDGSYRIWAMTGGLGKVHENFNEYYKYVGRRKRKVYYSKNNGDG